jgi:uncharacterized integral membrane protein
MRFLSWITLPPLTLATLYLAIANRHPVLFSLDPFNSEEPALALEVPLFAVVLFSVFLGILLGGASAWTRQGRWRKQARQTGREVKRLSKEVAQKPENLPVPTPSGVLSKE